MLIGMSLDILLEDCSGTFRAILSHVNCRDPLNFQILQAVTSQHASCIDPVQQNLDAK